MTAVTESDIKELKDLIKEFKNELKQDIAQVRNELKDVKNELKQDIAAARNELEDVKNELKQDIAQVRNELKQDIVQVKNEVKQDIDQVKNEVKLEIQVLKTEVIVNSTKIQNLDKSLTDGLNNLEKRISNQEFIYRIVITGIIGLILSPFVTNAVKYYWNNPIFKVN